MLGLGLSQPVTCITTDFTGGNYSGSQHLQNKQERGRDRKKTDIHCPCLARGNMLTNYNLFNLNFNIIHWSTISCTLEHWQESQECILIFMNAPIFFYLKLLKRFSFEQSSQASVQSYCLNSVGSTVGAVHLLGLPSSLTLCCCSGSKEEWGVGATFQRPAQLTHLPAGAAHHSQQPWRYSHMMNEPRPRAVYSYFVIIVTWNVNFIFCSVPVMIPAYSLNRGYSIFFVAFSVIGKKDLLC